MRLPIQTLIVLYYKEEDSIKYFLAKRTEQKGGFWQPISGGLVNGETLRESAIREVREETGLKVLNLTRCDYIYQFQDEKGFWLTEYLFIGEVLSKDVHLSEEHEQYRWVSLDLGLELLKYENNKEALKKAHESIHKCELKRE